MKRFYILFSYIISALIIYAVLFLPQSPVSGFDRVRELMLIIISLMLVRGFCYLSLNSWHDLLSFLRERKYRDVRYSPLVSVIIPAWNEEVGIRTTVESVCDSSYRNIEIIVVDDGSTDRTGEIVQKFIQKNRGPKGECGREITYIRQENA